MSNPKKIGIRFGDNDFYNTFIPFLTVLGEQGIDSYGNMTKEKFVELCNRSIVAFYWLYQNKCRDHWQTDHAINDYLKITEYYVYFDEEVDTMLKKTGQLDSDFFVLDTTVYGKPYVYAA